MTELTIYMAGVIIMMVSFAIRTEDADIAAALFLSAFWPISILAMIIIKCLWVNNWEMDIAGTDKWFHYRKPTNPEIKGFAVSLFKLEFQFWRKRKI